MSKVLIVDDESLIREWLVMCLMETGISVEQIDQAKNGAEALKLLEMKRYQYIFTDITMPKLDGIELIAKIRSKDENVIIFILTCHDDFQFARTALKYGVSDYLLKHELSKEDIIRLMAKYKGSPDSPFDYEEMEAYFQKVLHEGGQLERADLEKYGLNKNVPFFVLSFQKGFVDTGEIRKLQVKHIGAILAFYDGISKIFVIVGFQDRVIDKIKVMNNFKRELKKLLKDKVVVGESNILEDYDSIAEAMKQSDYNREIQFFGMESLEKHELGRVDEANRNQLKAYVKNLSRDIIGNCNVIDKERILQKFSDINTLFKSNQFLDSDFLKRSVIDILEVIETKAVLSHGGSAHFIPRIINANNWNEIEQYIKLFLQGAEAEENQNESIRAAKQYMNLNYDKQITLSELAGRAGLSDEYFSRLFKKEAGKNFTEYFTEMRMERARVLLESGVFSVNDVAEMVGIFNQSYFSSQFKRYFGVSPSSYKKI